VKLNPSYACSGIIQLEPPELRNVADGAGRWNITVVEFGVVIAPGMIVYPVGVWLSGTRIGPYSKKFQNDDCWAVV
jgi:hypothetical protein